MKLSEYKLVVLLLLLLQSSIFYGQNSIDRDYVVSTAFFDGGLHLRWAPRTFAGWKKGVDDGYTLVRLTNSIQGVSLNGEDQYFSAITLLEDYKGLTLQEWEDLLEVDSTDAPGSMALALHGEGLTVTSPDTMSIMSVRNLQQIQQTRYGFSLLAAESDFEVAVKGGFGFFDETAEEGNGYAYYLLASDGQPISFESATRIIVESAIDEPSFDISVDKPQVTVVDMTAYFQLLGDERASLYSFEYSSDNGQSWQDLNAGKKYPAVTTESGGILKVEFPWQIPTPSTQYLVRAYAYDLFQRETPAASESVIVVGQEPLPNLDVSISYINSGIEQDTIGWTFDVANKTSIKGFKVLRSRQKNGPFDTLTPTFLWRMLREYVSINDWSTAYYKVVHQDVRGGWHESYSTLTQKVDSIPPEPPKGCSGTIDKYGRYRLSWERSISDDVKAYEVYTNNSGGREFFKVPGVRTSDTMNIGYVPMDVLNREVYFQVRALDYRYNESLEPSETCILVRPDVIPPVPPVITPGVLNLNKLEINYVGSASTDVVSHVMERRQENGSEWQQIANIQMNDQISLQGVFEDTSIPFQATWEYRLVAADAAGNTAASQSLLVTPADLSSMPTSFSLTVIPDRTVQGMRLIWEYPTQHADMIEFVLYRGDVPGKVEQYRVLHPNSSYQVGTSTTGPAVLHSNTGTIPVNLSTVVTHGGVQYYRVEFVDQVGLGTNIRQRQFCYQVTARSYNGGAVAGISDVVCETYTP